MKRTLIVLLMLVSIALSGCADSVGSVEEHEELSLDEQLAQLDQDLQELEQLEKDLSFNETELS